uniref:Uncharacterized protein n=1 Tax=Tetranychus urticae TaxID=32264 RepID=T1KAZ6_TETUR
MRGSAGGEGRNNGKQRETKTGSLDYGLYWRKGI